MKRLSMILLFLSTSFVNANVVEITQGLPYVEVEMDGEIYKIERTQNPDAYLTNTFALTSCSSPPFFIEPFSVTKKVETYGELEVLNFISKKKYLYRCKVGELVCEISYSRCRKYSI